MNMRWSERGQKRAFIPVALFLLLTVLPRGNGGTIALPNDGNSDRQAETGPSYPEGEVLLKFKDLRVSTSSYSSASLADIDDIREYRTLSERTGKTYLHVRSASLSTETLLARFSQDPDVEAVSPNYRRRVFSIVPNDPKWGSLWGMKKIEAEDAWSITTGSADVVVGLIDTGVDYNHEDLRANIWVNPNEIAGNGIDDDGNGYVDDIHGYDFAADNNGANDSDPMDIDNHGTHVAGIVAAVGNNGTGVSGVNWNARIMSLKAERPDGYLYDSDSTEAIEYAITMKSKYHVNIVALNASFGGDESDRVFEDAIRDAANENIILVAAAGNGGDDDVGDSNDKTPQYPAGYDSPNIISVAASDPDDNLAGFSNFGATTVDLAAPGVSILSTVRQNSGQETFLKTGAQLLDAYPLDYAGLTPESGLTAYAIACGKGLSSSDFPVQVSKNIALVERGENYFRDKVRLAQSAGAIGVIIYNNQAGGFLGTIQEAGDWIPAITISQENGKSLLALGTPQVTLYNYLSSYATYQGTSMAAPHVTGAIALMAALAPNEDYLKRIGQIYAGADPVAALKDKTVTGGRLNLTRMLGLRLGISLTVARTEGKGWILTRDVGLVTINMEQTALKQVAGGTLIIERKEKGGVYSTIKQVAVADMVNGSYSYYDKYLEKKISYAYRVLVRNSQGLDVGTSSERTL